MANINGNSPRPMRRLVAGAIAWCIVQTVLILAAPRIGRDESIIGYGIVTSVSLLASWLLPFVMLRAKLRVRTIVLAAITIAFGWYFNPVRLFWSPVFPEEAHFYYIVLAGWGIGVLLCLLCLNGLRSLFGQPNVDEAPSDAPRNLADNLRGRARIYRLESRLSMITIIGAIAAGTAIFTLADGIATRDIDGELERTATRLRAVEDQHIRISKLVDSARGTATDSARFADAKTQFERLHEEISESLENALAADVNADNLGQRLQEIGMLVNSARLPDVDVARFQGGLNEFADSLDQRLQEIGELISSVRQSAIDSARFERALEELGEQDQRHEKISRSLREALTAAIDSTRFERALEELDNNLDQFAKFAGISASGPTRQMDSVLSQIERIAEAHRNDRSLRTILSSLSTRIGSVLLIIFLVQILAGLYRYSARMAGYYESRMDVASLADDLSQPDKLALLSKAPPVDFGNVPAAPTSDVKEMFVKIIEALKIKP